MNKVLFFQAHPDDLEFSCFHLIYYLCKRSTKHYEIKIGSLTRGEYGWPKHAEHFKGERLGKLRTKEFYNAIKVYGLSRKDIHFFEVIDGYVEFNKKTIHLVKEYLEEEQPDIIVACEPRNTYYRHSDHMNIGKIVYYILDKNLVNFGSKKPKLYFYASIGANFIWPFKKEEIPLAYKTIHLHKSQIHIWRKTNLLYKILIRHYGKKLKGWKYAEGYRRVYYGDERNKTEKLKFFGRLFLILNVKVWPEKITRH